MVSQNYSKKNIQPKTTSSWQGDFRPTTKEYNLFKDFWQLCKTHWKPDLEDPSTFYRDLIDASTEFTTKYKSSDLATGFDEDFVKDITMSFLHMVERKEKVLLQQKESCQQMDFNNFLSRNQEEEPLRS